MMKVVLADGRVLVRRGPFYEHIEIDNMPPRLGALIEPASYTLDGQEITAGEVRRLLDAEMEDRK